MSVAVAVPPLSGDARAARRLGAALDAAGFRSDEARARLGALGDAPPAIRDRPVLARRAGDDLLGSLLRLLVVELRVPAAYLTPALVDELEAAGVAAREEDAVVPRCCVRVHRDLLLASDLHGDDPPHDVVPGAQGPTTMLADLTVRRPVEDALDVGTGCGVHALLAARHARRVVATDVNPRALAFAAFNAALNGLEGVELRLGSFFEPVAGETFDLVVCNPPYVISPDDEFVFRDGVLGRDGVSEHVVRGIPRLLRDGGFASMLVAWTGNGSEAPRRWLEGSHCDAVLLHTLRHEALDAAALWNTEEPDPEAYAERVERWLAYYRREGISSIAYGAVVLHRGGVERFRELALAGRGPAGAQLERLLAPPPRELAAARLRRVPDAIVRRESGSGGTRWSLALDGGLGIAAEVDAGVAAVVEALDGTRTYGAVLDLLGVPREAGLALARGLLDAALVEPT